MARQKVESLFSYSLSRPYPFAWFTYAVVIGGTICAVLFSFVALAADGYVIDLQYTTELNATQDASHWFQSAPFSWISQTSASCQPALLTTGSTYFTSNLGFTYTLDKIWVEGSSGIQNGIRPAAAYKNAVLEDCDVRLIEIDFLRSDQTWVHDNFWTWGATTAQATVGCTFASSSGMVKANFTTKLPSVFQASNDDGSHGTQLLVLSTNITESASMWFGTQYMYSWYKQLAPAMSYSQIPMNQPNTFLSAFGSGILSLSRNPDVNDYASPDFFRTSATFSTNSGGLYWIHSPQTIADWANTTQNEGTYGRHLPKITTTIDSFAKSIYSLLLSDFGVNDRTNALTTREGVQWLGDQVDVDLATLSNNSYTGYPGDVQNAFDESGPAYQINYAYENVTEHLGRPPNLDDIKPSTIYTEYLCSVPQRKRGGALFFAVLLADLVFLQTVWQLLNTVATEWVQRRHDDANCCDGCARASVHKGEGRARSNDSRYQLLQDDSRSSSKDALQKAEPGGQDHRRVQTV